MSIKNIFVFILISPLILLITICAFLSFFLQNEDYDTQNDTDLPSESTI